MSLDVTGMAMIVTHRHPAEHKHARPDFLSGASQVVARGTSRGTTGACAFTVAYEPRCEQGAAAARQGVPDGHAHGRGGRVLAPADLVYNIPGGYANYLVTLDSIMTIVCKLCSHVVTPDSIISLVVDSFFHFDSQYL